jgi:hypothetical protein
MIPQTVQATALQLSSPVDMGNGLGIALVGMVTVFIGLVCLAVLLPMLENWVEGKLRRQREEQLSEESAGVARKLTPEEVVAVSAAIHAHFCLLDQVENMKLTWEAYEKPFTPWRLAGRAELLQESGSLQQRIRSR